MESPDGQVDRDRQLLAYSRKSPRVESTDDRDSALPAGPLDRVESVVVCRPGSCASRPIAADPYPPGRRDSP